MAEVANNRSLVFIGFMGAGKSSAVRVAADAGLAAVDTDELLEEELGGIDRFWERHGEAAFREREIALEVPLLERAEADAIASGGGSVLSEPIRAAWRDHLVVWIDVSADEAWRRVGGSYRPLAQDHERFEALLAERRPLYEAAADVIIPQGDERVVARALPFLLALRELPPGVRMLWAASESGEYPVVVGDGATELLRARSARGALGVSRMFAIADAEALRHHRALLPECEAVIEVEAAGDRKTLAESERVLRELARAGARRDDGLIAFGGGMVGDLAGFCAATYQRGIPIVHIPTTLVAQVDSAYGGKTGVDLPEAKNYVGAYHMPAAVVADPGVLATLPDAELGAGFVEILKTALIAGGSLWDRVSGLEELDPAGLSDVIFACARAKVDVVAADERDRGGRAVLNLGHTVGHAIETVTGYARYRHGEAVALGLLAALRLSGQDALREQVRELLAARGLPTELDRSVDPAQVAAATRADKKRVGARTPFVLVHAPGDVRPGAHVGEEVLLGAIAELGAPVATTP
jgi:shikimate kinase / 3-dehydroquinate synthase